ncbi:MAG: histidinol-phosphatase [Desulfobulbaceae bacterium]|jgi:histidinol-phosphatase (PHP family)|nr:histidinol-phosphatase [Desulfobulbaceae bacterium]
MIDISSDGHVHTRLCHHAEGEMEEYALAAIARGLTEIVFLEHLEEGVSYRQINWLTEEDFDYYLAEGGRLQTLYGDRLRIKLGVEVGYNPRAVEKIKARLAARNWDRIGISYHYMPLDDSDEDLNMLTKTADVVARAERYGHERILEAYFAGLIEAARCLPGTVLCHLDAALRHIDGLRLTEKNLVAIDSLLRLVKEKGMALEINTSGMVIRGENFPRLAIVQKALALGIPLVAASDAHSPGQVGRFFTDLPALTRQASRL